MHGLRRRRPALTPSRVWVAPAALEAMLREARARAPLETGGMLLGYVSPNTDPEDVVIERVIGPGPNAKHFSDRFEPDGHWQQCRLADAYQQSGRITTYLGDWHTHPDGLPEPSWRDWRTARRVARSEAARMSRPLMLIVASNAEETWTAMAYRWARGRLRAVAVSLAADE
jgi:integrative and conjugative element protein (TIGR02256 family)